MLIKSPEIPKDGRIMEYLIEDPTYLLIVIGLAALACVVALQVTQQGKFLYWAGGLILAGIVLFFVEQYLVTDSERIEAVVYDLAKAVEASDVPRIEAMLDPSITFGLPGKTRENLIPIRSILPTLKRMKFDFVRVSRLTTKAGAQTRLGTAEFRVTTSGTFDSGMGDLNAPAVTSEWSLGFRESSPGVWKVTRITALHLPAYASPVLQGDH